LAWYRGRCVTPALPLDLGPTRMLSALALGILYMPVLTRALGVYEPHSCSFVDVVHTNLPPRDVDLVRGIYLEVTDRTGSEPQPIAERLSKELGGFWDAYFMGSQFSYSVHCISYVELAGERWNVLLCRESEDAEAYHCGAVGLTLYSNGTLSPRRSDHTVLNHAAVAAPSMYENYLVQQPDRAASEAARMPMVVNALGSWTLKNLQQPGAADALRQEIERALPWAGTSSGVGAKWNVLIEREAGGHYYYSEEQFNLVVRAAAISVAIFDRRCYTLQIVDGRPS